MAPYASKGSGGSAEAARRRRLGRRVVRRRLSGGGSTPKAHSATAIHVAVHGTHYLVTWKGKASAWKLR